MSCGGKSVVKLEEHPFKAGVSGRRRLMLLDAMSSEWAIATIIGRV